MKIIGAEQYRLAYTQYIDSQNECTHWDYELPEGCGYPCCIMMNNAQDRVSKIWKKLTRNTKPLKMYG